MSTVIETPEQLGFRVELAGLGHRAAAWALDSFLRGLLLIVAMIAFGAFEVAGGFGLGSALFFVFLFALTWFYFVFFEVVMTGQSPGKRAFGLRVLGSDGLPVTLRQSILRNLARAADLIVVGAHVVPVGAAVIWLDPRARRLGDMVAGTIVVVEAGKSHRSSGRLPPIRDHDLPARVPLDREDVEALEAFVRRGALTAERRRELAAIITPTYARRLGRPAPDAPEAFLLALWARARRIETESAR